MHPKNPGFTLIEMMVAVAVAAILLTIAIPSFTHMISQTRLKSAAEALYADLRFARSEAIKRNRIVYLSFYVNSSDSSDWCYGLNVGSDCNCRLTDSAKSEFCDIGGNPEDPKAVPKIVKDNEFKGISVIDTASSFWLKPLRGTADSGSTTFQSADNKEIHVVVSTIGRVRLCSPSGAGKVSGYPTC